MPTREYRVLDDTGAVRAHATVDCSTGTVTYELGYHRETLDVVDARAVDMVLSEAVYRDLTPTGPTLRLEKNSGSGWELQIDEE